MTSSGLSQNKHLHKQSFVENPSMQTSCLETNLTKTVRHGVSERSPTSYNNRGFAVRLSWPVTESSLGPATLSVCWTPVHWYRHRNNQRHHGNLLPRGTFFLLRHEKKTLTRESKRHWRGKRENGKGIEIQRKSAHGDIMMKFLLSKL